MSTIAREFTQEQLVERCKSQANYAQAIIDLYPDDVGAAESCRIAEIALASLKAEPASFDDLRDAVAEVSGGNAMVWSDIYKGHQAVPFINFNSLVRIVEKFRTALPAPVVPDGWVMVPIEPTEDMIVEGFESEPDESFSDAEVWEEYGAMSGCQQAAHRAKLCWAAMINAAPKMENI